MATDIAFSLGVLGMVKGIPSELKVFLLTLAIADDIGAIIVIAFFYTDTLHVQALFVGLFFLLVMFGLRRIGVSRTIVFVVLGVAFWVAILQSGVHATIAGVILGFMVPTTPRLSLRAIRGDRRRHDAAVFAPPERKVTWRRRIVCSAVSSNW